jgi:hypothetical protein
MPKTIYIDETEYAYERVKERDIVFGDFIIVHSNNQEGYKKYKVVNLGKKCLELIETFDDWIKD